MCGFSFDFTHNKKNRRCVFFFSSFDRNQIIIKQNAKVYYNKHARTQTKLWRKVDVRLSFLLLLLAVAAAGCLIDGSRFCCMAQADSFVKCCAYTHKHMLTYFSFYRKVRRKFDTTPSHPPLLLFLLLSQYVLRIDAGMRVQHSNIANACLWSFFVCFVVRDFDTIYPSSKRYIVYVLYMYINRQVSRSMEIKWVGQR